MADALAIVGLRKSFGGLPAINGVTITVRAGERRLLLGPNGAGKTTLFNLITGELRPDGGRIEVFGRDTTGLRPDRCAHLGVGRTYQILTLFPRITLVQNVVLALLGVSARRWDPLTPLTAHAALWTRARAVLARVGLDDRADRPVVETSYGEQRRLEIAMALAQSPRLLLLDEPFAGLSQPERHLLQGVLAAIPRDVTVLMIEHDMDVALALADRITVLHYGQVIVEGTRAEIVTHPRVREIYLGG
ncbi:MAG TPA: ABC transporter ATP-binding protein [Candidatus Binatia bacterium]|nr:ABC transporter ATP-binding protein [Candidatus Binatia bacterium]